MNSVRNASIALLASVLLTTLSCSQDESAQSLQGQLNLIGDGQKSVLNLTDHSVTDADLVQIREHQGLQQLHVGGDQITDEGLAQLAALSELEQFIAREATLTDDSIDTILSWPNLKVLNVPRCQFTEEGLARLSELPQLELLRIGGEQLSDNLFLELKSFPALRFLLILDASITDVGLKQVYDMKRLESLYLDRTQVTEKGIQALEKKRPKLHLHFGTSPE